MIQEFFLKTLTPQISPMVYIMMFVSVFIGFCFGFNILVGGSESVLYDTGVLVHKQAWGGVLFVTASTALIGFLRNNDDLIRLGGMAGWMAWLFACISLFLESHWYILISVGIFHLLFHGYVVLATSLGFIRRAPIRR
jgi:hypothetical protein